jgi:predicted unusual protein kinase regulating ubiquinone biosynthesis (AarF/ABC1/UbiB family)
MNAPSGKAPRTSRLARSVIAGATAARVGVKQARHRMRANPSPQATAAHEHEIGGLIFSALTQLRGTALKAAQVLSMDANLLPPGVRAQLARATHQALPLNRALVSRAFRQAFGCEPQALYAQFEPEAFAAASLGQVHRARLADGTEVAVKVQYPGIAETIASDLRLLRASLSAIGRDRLGLPSDAVVDAVLDDIRRQLALELDYRHEAGQQAWFAEHAAHPDVGIARVIPELTCTTVLTQHFMPGRHVDAWLALQPTQGRRDRAGQALFDAFLRSAFVHRRIHADLHPGNVLFDDDGRVVLLDFGSTCELGAGFLRGLARSWWTWLQHGAQGAEALLAIYRELGIAASDLSVSEFERLLLPQVGAVLAWATQPFTREHFDFAGKSPMPAPDFGDRSQRAVSSFMTHVPPEMISFDRAWLGLMHLLSRLQCRVDVREARALLEEAAR